MRPRLIMLIALVLLASLPLAAGKKKVALYLRTNQKAELVTVPTIVARQRCPNWLWAAALEHLLRMQNAAIPQQYWVQHLNGGELCLDRAGNFTDLAAALSRQDMYVLDDGRKFRLEAQFAPGPPQPLDALIFAVRANQPRMLLWRGRAYLVSAVLYDEHIAMTGSRLFEAREFHLIDVAEPPASKARLVTFQNGRDNPAEIDGMFDVRVVWK
jgi:hypothetical protein